MGPPPSRVRGEQRAENARDEIAVHDDDGVGDEAIARRADRVRGVGDLGGGEDSDVARAPVRIREPLAEDRRVRLAGGDEEDVADAARSRVRSAYPQDKTGSNMWRGASSVRRPSASPRQEPRRCPRGSHREIEADDRGGADAMCERRRDVGPRERPIYSGCPGVRGRILRFRRPSKLCPARPRNTFCRALSSARSSTMAPRRPALVSAFAFLALSALASAAREPFDGAVHSHPGVDAEDDGMTETHGAFDGFADRTGAISRSARSSPRPSWQVPQYHVDGTAVRLRGWLATNARPAGTPVFRLPDEAVPGRRETWRVTMKGTVAASRSARTACEMRRI